jgi:hypothetical protein
MALPILAPAPVVTAHAAVFRALLENQCQFRPFQPDLTGRIVPPNKSPAPIARGLLDRAAKTNLSRFCSEAPWRADERNRRRIRFMLQQPKPQRQRRREALVVIEETRCEHVGTRCDQVDRHDNHRDGTSPVAHNPVPSVSVRGPVRCPVSLRLYRRDEDLTQWAAAVATQFPDLPLPRDKQARNRRHPQVDPVLLQDPECRARHEPCRATIALAVELLEEAIRHKGPLGVVVFDAWSLAEELGRVLARRRKDWSRLRNPNRRLETAGVQLRDVTGWAMKLPGPHLALEALVPLIPATA